MHVGGVAGTTSSDVMRFLLGNPGRGLGDDLFVMRLNSRQAVLVDVSGASTSGRVGTVALVAGRAFTNDLAIDIGGVVGFDVGGT